MKFYSYDCDTKIFSGIGLAQKNPKKPEEYLFPPNTTTVQPPVMKQHEAAIFNGEYWEIIPDYRGLDAVEIETGDVIEVKDVGKLRQGLMLISDYQKTDMYRQREFEKKINDKKNELMNELEALDRKRIRAICEPKIKNKDTGETWLDYYNAQIIQYRLKLKEMDYGT